MIAWAQMGDANASIPTPQPVMARPMFGADIAAGARRWPGWRPPRWRTGWPTGWPCAARCVAVARHPRAGQGRPAARTTPLPAIEVDPRTFAVRIDGELVTEDPVAELPLAQRYSLF